MLDPLRLAFGTLTLLPVRPVTPSGPDAWRRALVLAPLVGLLLGLLAYAASWAVTTVGGVPLLGAVAVVATLAVLTRGLHLDGLADVADALGSRLPPEGARVVMRRSDVGPFGVVTLVLVLIAQVTAVGQLLAQDAAGSAVAVVGAGMVSRAMLTWTCRTGVTPAGSAGLGAAVAESVPCLVAALVLALTAVVVVASSVAAGGGELALAATGAVALAVAAGELWRRHCSRRLGGVTGDILGATEQVSWSAFVVAFALVLA